MKKIYFFLCWLFVTQFVSAQLSDFTLEVSVIHETCVGNGALNFKVTGTAPGASIIYSVYKIPDEIIPIAVISAASIGGLTSGVYKVVASQALNNENNSKEEYIEVLNQKTLLTYTFNGFDEICGGDGEIQVNTITGSAVLYEILDGPVIKTMQTSNIFSGLVQGKYKIRVFDSCGEGVVETFTLSKKDPTLSLLVSEESLVTCDLVSIGFDVIPLVQTPDGVIKYPLQITTKVDYPDGTHLVLQSALNNTTKFKTNVLFFDSQKYNYSFLITDGCGKTYTLNGEIDIDNSILTQTKVVDCTTKKIHFYGISGLVLIEGPQNYPVGLPQNFTDQIVNHEFETLGLHAGNYVFQAIGLCGDTHYFSFDISDSPPGEPYAVQYGVTCKQGSFVFGFISTIILVSAPDDFVGALPYDFSNIIDVNNITVLQNVPLGTYVFEVTNLCGEKSILTADILFTVSNPSQYFVPECDDNTSRLAISGDITKIVLVAAPSTYKAVLPVDLTADVVSGALTISSLPSGTYVFKVHNSCDIEEDYVVDIPANEQVSSVMVIQNCGSFDLDLHDSPYSPLKSYWLQKFYPLQNDWGNPVSGDLAGNHFPDSSNAISLNNNSLNLNLYFIGRFRVLRKQIVTLPGDESPVYCYKQIYEFQTNDKPQITDVKSILCNGAFDVLVNANGVLPLIYRIVAKDGAPYLLENGNSSLFENIDPGLYSFQVIDNCGNVLNSDYEINTPNPIEIKATGLCPAQSAILTVPPFSFLTYKWWKGSDTSNVLSVKNLLNLDNFNPETDSGTYYVNINYSGNPNSCLNFTLSYTIEADAYFPDAGDDVSVSFCGNQSVVNLDDLLSGDYDPGGIWESLDTGINLVDSIWDSTGVSPGIFHFKYMVKGDCSSVDESVVSIEIKSVPDIAKPVGDIAVCVGEAIHLFIYDSGGEKFHWIGPDGFDSSEQNPVIANATELNSGMYSVQSELNGCFSVKESLGVLVNPLPDFTIEGKCVNAAYVLDFTPINDSFSVGEANFSWKDPSGLESEEKPLVVTGKSIGIYGLSVTDKNGCTASKVINVQNTNCSVPNVITPNDDGANDFFNLTGQNVNKIEIYNRWGRMVYEKYDYTNEWHGQNMNGGRLPDSTYFYILFFQNGESKNGWIFLSAGM